MMKKLLFSFCLLFALNAFAQEWVANADSVMNRVQKTLKTDPFLRAGITLTQSKNDSLISKQSGTFSWQHDRMNIRYVDSVGKLSEQILQVRDTAWIYDGELNRVTIVHLDDERISNGSVFFVTPKSGLDKKVKAIHDSVVVVAFFPKDAKSTYSEIDVTVNIHTCRETSMRSFNKNGSMDVYELEYQIAPAVLSPREFVFDKSNYPAGLQVFDYSGESDY